jgi:hypothetical protein
MARSVDDTHDPNPELGPAPHAEGRVEYIKVGDIRSSDDEDTCLRPLGLCELGGSCDSCWYRPDHPRFQK